MKKKKKNRQSRDTLYKDAHQIIFGAITPYDINPDAESGGNDSIGDYTDKRANNPRL